jgi:hypothetical protein
MIMGFWGACGLRERVSNILFHHLRHTFVTRLVERGVDLISIKELLGRSSGRLTERYTHPNHTRECQIFCVNPFFAFKRVHPSGQQNRSSVGSISWPSPDGGKSISSPPLLDGLEPFPFFGSSVHAGSRFPGQNCPFELAILLFSGRSDFIGDVGPFLEAFLPPGRESIVPGIRSAWSSTGCFFIISSASRGSMRAASRGSTGFAVLRREANEGGYFRPIVKEVVERYLDCGNPR